MAWKSSAGHPEPGPLGPSLMGRAGSPPLRLLRTQPPTTQSCYPSPGEPTLLRPEIRGCHPHCDGPIPDKFSLWLGPVPHLGWPRRRWGELKSEAVFPHPP